jgi:hypothetical protein
VLARLTSVSACLLTVFSLYPLKDLLAAFLERAQASVQCVLNRFSRRCGVAS